MSYKNGEFKPVLPSISDDSMRVPDRDVEHVRTMRSRKVRKRKPQEYANTSNTSSDNGSDLDADEDVGDDLDAPPVKTMMRKVVIGVLIGIIVILVIILIYQIYKYYSEEKKPEAEGGTIPHPGVRAPHAGTPAALQSAQQRAHAQQAAAQTASAQDTRVAEPKKADRIANLDSSMLNRFLTKTKNTSTNPSIPVKADQHTSERMLHHRQMESDLADAESRRIREEHKHDAVDMAEIERLASIIDDANGNNPDSASDIPSKDDLLSEMQAEMEQEADTRSELQIMAEQNGMAGNIDALSLYDDTKCRYTLSKGPRQGQNCGKKSTYGNRCTAHHGK
jgi:hypothetical protein